MNTGQPAGLNERSFLSLLNVVLRRRVLVVGTMFAFGFVAGLVSITSPRTFSASAAFVPETNNTGTNLGGIAAQFGVALPAGEPAQSPDFYADLLRSREILGRVVDTRFPTAEDTAGLLAAALEVTGETEALRRDAAIRRLADLTAASVSSRTGVVRLTVRMPDPDLAQRVASRYMEILNRFNLSTRQSRGASEREFAGQRVAEVREDLREAEDLLQEFMQRNRDGLDSPELAFEYDRLSREVTMQQQIYTSLAQAYEEARIDEVRDTPVISVIENPTVPLRRDSRGTVFKTVFGLFLGGMLGIVLAYWREFIEAESRRPDVAEFLELKARVFEDLKHPIRALKGRSSVAGS